MQAIQAETVVLTVDHRGTPAVRAAGAAIAARLPGAGEGRQRIGPPGPEAPSAGDRAEPGADKQPAASAPASASARPGRSRTGRDGTTRTARVAVRVFTSAAQEAGWIADQLRRAHLIGGVPWSRMAVLARSARRALPALRRALLAAGVPIAAPPDELPLARQPAVVPLLMVLRYAVRPGELDADAATALLTSPLGSADPLRMRRLRRGLLRLQAAGVDLADPAAAPGVGVVTPAISADVAEGLGVLGTDADGSEPAKAGGGVAAGPAEAGGGVAAGPAKADGGATAAGRGEGADRVALSAAAEAERVGSDPLLIEALRAAAAGRPDPLDALPANETAPLRRVGALLAIAGDAARAGESAEEVLWRVWQACGLDRRWNDASARGGPVGAAADRDLDAVLALFDAAARFADRLPGADIATFTEYLAEQQLPGDSLADRTPRRDAVELLTAHAARGREWDVVAVPGVQEGAWPDLRLRGSLLGNERLVDLLAGVAEPTGATVSRVAPLLAEERRLFYVACTRARHTLLVSAVQGEDEQPSRFLDELDPLPAGQADRPVHRPGRALVLAELVGELRRAACAPDGPDRTASAARRARAAAQLARLAEAGIPGAHPDDWYGAAPVSTDTPLRPADAVVPVSPSDVEKIMRCPLRWVLERHGGSDAGALAAVTGSLGARTGPGRGGGRGHRRAGCGPALGLGAARRGRPVVLPPRAHPGARHARRVRQLGAGQPGRGPAAGRGRAARAARPGRRGRGAARCPGPAAAGPGRPAGGRRGRAARRRRRQDRPHRGQRARRGRAPPARALPARGRARRVRHARRAGRAARRGPARCTSPTSAPTARPRNPSSPRSTPRASRTGSRCCRPARPTPPERCSSPGSDPTATAARSAPPARPHGAGRGVPEA